MADTSFLDWRLSDLVVESSPAPLKVFGAISSRGTIYLLTFTNITRTDVNWMKHLIGSPLSILGKLNPQIPLGSATVDES